MGATLVLIEDEPFGQAAARDRAKAAFVIQLVALVTGVPASEITRASRSVESAVRARWLAMYLLNVALSVPLMRVAAAFGRDRSSVGQAVSRLEDWRSDAMFDAAVTALERCALAAPIDLPVETFGHGFQKAEEDQ